MSKYIYGLMSVWALSSFVVSAQFRGRTEAQAKRLEERLMAPCCWIQTLDVHESPLATELRIEIRQRFEKGESSDAIEASLVSRYGKRLVAVPKQSDPRNGMDVAVPAFMALALGALLWLGRRWTRNKPQAFTPPQSSPVPDAQLDEALRKIDAL